MNREETGGRSPPPEQAGREEQRSASRSGNLLRRHWRVGVVAGLVLGAGLAAAAASSYWLPPLRGWLQTKSPFEEGSEHGQEAHGELHADEEPAGTQAGHDEATTIELSEEAQRNVGLSLVTVEPRDFQRTVSVPATVIERPGRSQMTVSAPMTGIVTKIYPIRGEAVTPGDPLFELRLTHEDMVEKQASFLRDLEQLDVVKQELTRARCCWSKATNARSWKARCVPSAKPCCCTA